MDLDDGRDDAAHDATVTGDFPPPDRAARRSQSTSDPRINTILKPKKKFEWIDDLVAN
jgi:hypothetical protein